MRLAKGKMQGHGVHARGGPWDGKVVFIPNGGTMVFSLPFNGVKCWRGHYDRDGKWITLK